MAATGQVVDGDGQPHMIIFNGRRQELDRITGKLSELAFDQYVLDLAASTQCAIQPRARSARTDQSPNC